MRLRTSTQESTASQAGTLPRNKLAPREYLNSLRSEGESFAQAADEAISKALSGDSEDFLRRSRQQGGQ